MHTILNFLASAAGVYLLLIFIRIIISWFSGTGSAKPVKFLSRITDPYLDWWRRNLNLRIGFMDLSPIVAISALSVFQNIIHSITRFDRVTIGNILTIVLLSVWSIVSFLLGFFIIILVLRLIAYLTNRDTYSGPFWRVVDSISQPLLYKLNKIIFRDRVKDFMKGIILSLLLLVAIRIGGGYLMPHLANFLAALPL